MSCQPFNIRPAGVLVNLSSEIAIVVSDIAVLLYGLCPGILKSLHRLFQLLSFLCNILVGEICGHVQFARRLHTKETVTATILD
jgi:hypothetical protein